MQTAIGRNLEPRSARLAWATAVGLGAVALDLLLAWWMHYPESSEGPYVLALIALAIQTRLVDGDVESLGLTATPAPRWQYWIGAALLMGLGVCFLCAAAGGLWILSGREIPIHTTPPDRFAGRLLGMCVFAPVYEETLYRLALCVPLTRRIGPWGAIVVSGVLFGALHVVRGVPSPENLFGGMILAWAYLRSGSILVPVLLHSLGNLCVLAMQVGASYWLTQFQ